MHAQTIANAVNICIYASAHAHSNIDNPSTHAYERRPLPAEVSRLVSVDAHSSLLYHRVEAF